MYSKAQLDTVNLHTILTSTTSKKKKPPYDMFKYGGEKVDFMDLNR